MAENLPRWIVRALVHEDRTFAKTFTKPDPVKTNGDFQSSISKRMVLATCAERERGTTISPGRKIERVRVLNSTLHWRMVKKHVIRDLCRSPDISCDLVWEDGDYGAIGARQVPEPDTGETPWYHLTGCLNLLHFRNLSRTRCFLVFTELWVSCPCVQTREHQVVAFDEQP